MNKSLDNNRPREMQSELQFQWFAVMWALCTLFELVALESLVRGWRALSPGGYCELFLALSALVVIWRPSVTTLTVMATLQVIDLGIMLPTAPNHRVVTGLVNLTFLASVFAAWRPWRSASAECLMTRLWTNFAPAARIETILVYLFAALAKYNTGFVNPETSCGSNFYLRLTREIPIFPDAPWAAQMAIATTIVCESAIPLLLLSRRTRLLAVGVGVWFHFMLSLDYFQHTMDFSSLMYALLFLFLPSSYLEKIKVTLCGGQDRASEIRWARLLIVASWAIVLTAGLLMTDWGARVFYYSRHVVWYSYAVAIIAICAYLFWRAPPDSKIRRTGFFDIPALLPQICVALLALNGMGPYLGFKTRSALDMYSNLRMEQPRPNHLLIPKSLDIFGLQGDRVRVLESNDARMQMAKLEEKELLYFTFSSYVFEHPELRGRFLRNGVELGISSEADWMKIEPPPLLARKLLWFRDVDLQPEARCDW